MKFVASRLSEGNKIFPAEIHIEENGIKVKIPGFFSGDTRFINYEHITAVDINTPMIGYSSITFYNQGNKAFAHGFRKDEARQIKEAIDNGKARAKIVTVNHVTNEQYNPQQTNPTAQPPQTTIVNKGPSFLSTAASALGGVVNNAINESRKSLDNQKEEAHRSKDKIEELALFTLSSDKDELLNQLNYLVSLGNSKPDKNLKNVIIEKLEFGIMKLKGQNAHDEAAFFDKKLEPLKKKNPFDFLQ